ncbi:nuclear-interacting partner of ALK [Corythoichthys intestinalis]|uniref:nuclear-interacting partner of ALK n=1 Tax=Corythoichthys intestinalis TaxID=161448 RepID=UPI0025A50D46|nr:nuclear-interacting partner of ALK [Corythoichthys intestinalis]XP_061809112.1 zinc finger C3HC-type protein 1-like isoform X2 [Nerophis lumbriciformis]
MAAVSSGRADRLGNANQNKSSLTSPEKIRELLSEGVSPASTALHSGQGDSKDQEVISTTPSPCEATNKEAFFIRVQSYSCLKWAGKPHALSPLMCARYGWINIAHDTLKCSSCQAFLCASLQLTLDFDKYESRVAELSRQLQTKHEKFCPWPDFPCPERLWIVTAEEPSELLTAFIERYQSACRLGQQLPSMKPELLKSMSLTEDVLSAILQLVEEEQKKKGTTCSEPFAVQVAACIVSLCGWASNPGVYNATLPILYCSYCMRKVGMWNFHQMESAGVDADVGMDPPSTSVVPAEGGQGEQSTPPSPTPPSTPSRMKLRSQDSCRSDQGEGIPVALRARSRDSPSPVEESPSPSVRGKRPATRSRGQGESLSLPSKRLCLSLADEVVQKSAFEPLAQHRDWCPWVAVGKENVDPRATPLSDAVPAPHQQGWKAVLDLLMPAKNTNTVGSSTAQDPPDRSKRVFAIFRQWQIATPSQ